MELSLPRPRAKALGLLTLAGLLLIFTVFAVALPFREDRNIIYWLWVMALMVFTLNSLALTMLFPYTRKTFLAVAVAAAFSVLVLFPWHNLLILGALIILWGVWYMDHLVRKTENQFLGFSYYGIVKRGMNRFLVAVILLASLGLYIQTASELKKNPEGFYQNMSAMLVKSVQPVLQSKVRGFDSEMTLDDFLLRSEVFGPVEYKQSGHDFVLDPQYLPQIRDQFLSLFGLEASGSDQAMNVFERIVLVRVKDLFEPVGGFVPFIYALILFLSLRFIVPFVVWIAGGLGAIIFKLFLKFGWVKMTQRPVTIEAPELT